MPNSLTSRTVTDPVLGEVTLRKIKRARHIRLRLLPNGTLQVTLPFMVTFQYALRFAQSQKDWVAKHQPEQSAFTTGDRIGERYSFDFEAADQSKITTRINGRHIRIKYPSHESTDSPLVQKAAHQAAIRALRREAETELPRQLREIATAYGFDYSRVDIRQLRSRWGSCNSEGVINLNVFLMMLDQSLIEYVLVHELAHTKELNHSPKFWAIVEAIIPDAKQRRKVLKTYQPYLFTK